MTTVGKAAPTPTSERSESLFFSFVPCHFRFAEAAAYNHHQHSTSYATEPAEVSALKRRAISLKPEGSLPTDPAATLWRPVGAQSPLVLDAVPAYDLNIEYLQLGPDSWPSVLQRPLVKCAEHEADVSGYASGVRSAVIQDATSGKWYRLKGCGNNADGFPIVPVLDDAGNPLFSGEERLDGASVPLRKIRGACYLHTATLELHISAKVGALLAPYGMRCANEPCGWWEYDLPSAEFPEVRRCCSVFECEGDRRLGDHILRGLEMLLDQLPGAADASELARSKLLGTGGVMERSAEALRAMDDEMEASLELGLICGGGSATPPSSFCDLASVPLPSLAPPTAAQFPAGAPAELRQVWDQACDSLRASGALGGTLLGRVFERLGWECGVVSKVPVPTPRA
jgi:hypothetical protein